MQEPMKAHCSLCSGWGRKSSAKRVKSIYKLCFSVFRRWLPGGKAGNLCAEVEKETQSRINGVARVGTLCRYLTNDTKQIVGMSNQPARACRGQGGECPIRRGKAQGKARGVLYIRCHVVACRLRQTTGRRKM